MRRLMVVKRSARNIVVVLVLAAVAILALSACTGSGDQTPTPTPPTVATPAATLTPPAVEAPTVFETPVADTTPMPLQRPVDFTVNYKWRAGSMPPPFHYEYSVVIGPGTEGKVVYTPNYPSDGVPTWTETFSVTSEQLDQLYNLVLAKKVFATNWQRMQDFPVGGSQEWADVTANGREISIPEFVQSPDDVAAGAIYSTVKEFVPQAIW